MLRFSLLLLLLSFCLACAEENPDTSEPQISSISTHDLVIGESLEFFGRNLPYGEEGQTRLRFLGQFSTTEGNVEQVNVTLSPTFNGLIGDEETELGQKQALILSRFGPFQNPFTGSHHSGQFEGKVYPVTETEEGEIFVGEGMDLSLKVGPSISILEFAPLEAECSAPALRGLAGIPYVMRVRSSGILPQRFRYEFTGINGSPGVTVIEHEFGSPVSEDQVGAPDSPGGPIFFDMVPEDQQSYIAAIRVLAIDAKGNIAETALPFPIHRPMEVVYDGNYEMAERYEPEAVSGCIPGNISTQVSYSETITETRQQVLSVTLSSSWSHKESTQISSSTQEGISTGFSESHTMGASNWEGESTEEGYGLSYSQNESNNVSYSSSDGERWDWNLSEGESNEDYQSRMNSIYGEGSVSGTVGVSAEGSIPGFAKATGGVEVGAGVSAGARTAGTEGNRQGINFSRGYGMGGSSDEQRSFGSTMARAESHSLAGSYAVSQGHRQNESDTEARDRRHVWNLSEGEALSREQSEQFSESEKQTWVNSSSLSTSQRLQGRIPASQTGMYYRQVTRFVKRAELRSYDLCGLGSHVGELQMNDWAWAAELAFGKDCLENIPQPELLPAQCFIPPCD